MNTRMMFAWVAADGAGEEGISRAETRIPQPKAVREADALAGVRRRGGYNDRE